MGKHTEKVKAILGFITGGVAFGLLFVAWVYPEVPTATYALGGLLIVLLSILAWLNQVSLKEAVKTRSVRYGMNTMVSIGLVLSIIVVLNYLNNKHYYRKDLTKEQIHSLSDQTKKILRNLKTDLSFTAFVKPQQQEGLRQLFETYKYHTKKKISVEFVDPDRDPARAKSANVKKYGTVIIEANNKDARIEEADEEKLTNALIKVLKEKSLKVCFLKGHGEKAADSEQATGYSRVKQELESQSYETKIFGLLETGKVPEDCDAMLVLGPQSAFLAEEVKVIREWLKNGGRALFALDPDVKRGQDRHPEISAILKDWYVKVDQNLVIDPTSRLLGAQASVPIVGIYNKAHAITQEFSATTLFPITSTITLLPGAPSTLKTSWIAKSTPNSIAKSDFKEIASGKVRIDPKKDKKGPLILVVAVEGEKDARVVVMGTSNLAANSHARYGANIDLFLNSVSWLVQDESLISIRTKKEKQQTLTLSQTEGNYISLMTGPFVPLGVILFGTVVWYRRRKL